MREPRAKGPPSPRPSPPGEGETKAAPLRKPAPSRTEEPEKVIRLTSDATRKGPSVSPRDLLLPYQRKWVEDSARFKYGLWSRQTGKDFSAGAEGVEDSLKNPKTTWLIGAAGERQAMESLSKWKEWAEAYKFAIEDYVEDRDAAEALIKSGTITWSNGSRVIAVPANPNTVRGYSANLVLTEFAFIEDPDATWRAVLPSITNPLRGGLKKVRIITTPNGVGNKAHDLWQKNYQPQDATNPLTPALSQGRGSNDARAIAKGSALTPARKDFILREASPAAPRRGGTDASLSAQARSSAKWSCHKVTIYDAVAQGLPIDVEELRAAIDDPEGWAQEFECEFMDVSSVLLPYELIASCESLEATAVIPFSFWEARISYRRLVMGIDFGRKKDLTAAWTNEILGDVAHTREVLELAKMPTPDQVNHLRPRIKQCVRVCLDYSGPGIGMGDYLVKEFGEFNPEKDQFGKIELCTFTAGFKQEIFPKLKMAFEAKRLRVPVSRIIREDLHAIHRVIGTAGQISYKAPHTEDGHSDRATGLALAVRAGDRAGSPFVYQAVNLPGRVSRRSGALV